MDRVIWGLTRSRWLFQHPPFFDSGGSREPFLGEIDNRRTSGLDDQDQLLRKQACMMTSWGEDKLLFGGGCAGATAAAAGLQRIIMYLHGTGNGGNQMAARKVSRA